MVKYIPLTQGKKAKVDDKDYSQLNKHKWSAQPNHQTYYAIRGLYDPKTKKTTTIKMHNQIMGSPEGKVVDHKDGDGLNNTRANLHIVSPKTNANNRQNMEANKSVTDGARGTIWSEGVHNVWVDKEPARVRVPQYTIPETYQKFKKQIETDGGITIGLDHIPEELLKEYPILSKLDPLDVGRITEVQTDGSRIYATKSEHTNPLIAELYAQGDLKSYSVVAPMLADVDEGDDADYIFNKFKNIKRMDYVDEGGCTTCKVDNLPDNLILTAKLSMEVDKLTEEENNQNETNETEETMNTSSEENNPEQNETEQEYATIETFKDAFKELKDLLNTPPATGKLEAKVAEMEIKAKKAEIQAQIDTKIREGTIKPAQAPGLLEAGLSMKPEDFSKHLDTYDTPIVDLKQHSIHAGKAADEKEYTHKTYQARREAGYAKHT